jgi:hypothetical protein
VNFPGPRFILRRTTSPSIPSTGKTPLMTNPIFRSTVAALAAVVFACAGVTARAQSPAAFPGTTAVGQSSAALTVTVTMTGSGIAAAPLVLTEGQTGTPGAGVDFALGSGGGSCAANTVYTAGQTCTVSAVFQPTYPGVRIGAAVVKSTTGALLGSTLLSGKATGSLAVLQPGYIATLAGDGAWIYQKDGVAGTAASIFLPMGVVTDPGGNLYLSDSNNNRVRKVSGQSGLISTIGGTGIAGYSGDGGAATQAMVNMPSGMAIDGAGDIYFADTSNHIIRRIDAVTNIITTVAGTPGQQGYSGDNAAATQAKLTSPEGIAFDAAGDLLIADTGNNVIRKVNASTGVITTIAGTGVAGYSGDGILAAVAQLSSPWSVTVGYDGTIYIADFYNNRVRAINSAGFISTIAGTGARAFSGDGSSATAAALNEPAAVAVDPSGDVFIADSGNDRVREVQQSTGIINTVVGTGSEQFTGDGGNATSAGLYGPYALYLDGAGNLFIADMFHNRVRSVSANAVVVPYPTMSVGKTSEPVPVLLENEGNANLVVSSFAEVNSALDPATTTCAVSTPQAVGSPCTLGVEFAPTTVGTLITGTLTVNSNAGGIPPVVQLSGQVLSVNPTSISLSSSANPSLLGAAVTFTANIGSSNGTLTGTVVFFDGTTQLCSVTLVNNAATCMTSSLALGSHNITADYSGDTKDAAADSAVLVQVVKQADTLTLTASPNPVVVSGNVTLTLTDVAPTGTATGTVTFFDGTTAIGSAALNASGVASFSTTQLTAGTHSLSANYAGDTANAAGTSNVVSEVVQQASTVTTLSSSQGTVTVGTTVTFSATVTTTNGPAPTGTVNFYDGTTLIGSGTLNGSGLATLTTAALTPGTHKIVATYAGDANDTTSSSMALVEIVNQIGTTTLLASDTNPASAGVTIHFTATVSIASGATADGAITGNVTFTDGGTTLGTAALNASGQAVLAVSNLAAGSHAIIASYAGNTNYATSNSPALGESITSTATTTAINASASPIYPGQTETVTVTVTSATGGIPTQNVSIHDGALVIGQATLNAQGVAVFSTTTLAVGTHTLSAVYAGDGNYQASTSGSVTVVVQQAPSTTTLTTSANPSIVGQSVTLTAAVTSVTAGASGQVIFMDGSATLATIALGANGTASFLTSSLTFGAHTLTAVYSGDTNHAGSTSAVVNEQIVQTSTAVLTSSVNPATSGTNVVFTATIAGTAGTPPSGSVIFRDGTTVLGTVTLTNGTASFAISTLAVGSHTITVSYAGDTNYAASSATLTETIQNASTQIALTASANPATYATPLSLVAAITSNGGIATGVVTFTDGGATVGTATLDATGTATLTTSTLAPGTHSIVANYAGDGKASASVSTPLIVVVKELTQIALTTSANPAQTLSSVVLTATVANSGVGVPSGTVTFMDGSATLGTATLNAAGVATFTVTAFTAGSHSLVASYGGDATDFSSASAALAESVTLRPTTTSLTATPTNPNNAQEVTLIAVVDGNGTPAPSGKITFTIGTTTLGSSIVGSTGVATLDVILQTMTETITATYSGDASYAASASPATSITGGAATQFTLQMNPSSATIASKQRTTVNITLSSLNNFSDTLNLGCLGLPYAATCTFSTTSTKLAANGTQSVQLIIDTGDPLGAGSQASLRTTSASGVMMCLLPLGALLGFSLRRRRKLLGLLAVLFVAALTLTASGCGGLTVNGTPAGTYTFSVAATGQGTGASEAQNFTLTVTQ